MPLDPCTQSHPADYCCQERHEYAAEQIDRDGDAIYWLKPCLRTEPGKPIFSLGFMANFESLEALDAEWSAYMKAAFPA